MLVNINEHPPRVSALGSDFASFDEAVKFVAPMTSVMSKDCQEAHTLARVLTSFIA